MSSNAQRRLIQHIVDKFATDDVLFCWARDVGAEAAAEHMIDDSDDEGVSVPASEAADTFATVTDLMKEYIKEGPSQ